MEEFNFNDPSYVPPTKAKRAKPKTTEALTLRDQFALASLPSLLSGIDWNDINAIKRATNQSYLVANLMLAERIR